MISFASKPERRNIPCGVEETDGTCKVPGAFGRIVKGSDDCKVSKSRVICGN